MWAYNVITTFGDCKIQDGASRQITEADYLLTPSSVTPALRGLESTGDPAFNAPWSFCGFPTITVPCGLTGDGLPLGLQLTGLPYGEEGLLSVAGWCERFLYFPKGPRNP